MSGVSVSNGSGCCSAIAVAERSKSGSGKSLARSIPGSDQISLFDVLEVAVGGHAQLLGCSIVADQNAAGVYL